MPLRDRKKHALPAALRSLEKREAVLDDHRIAPGNRDRHVDDAGRMRGRGDVQLMFGDLHGVDFDLPEGDARRTRKQARHRGMEVVAGDDHGAAAGVRTAVRRDRLNDRWGLCQSAGGNEKREEKMFHRFRLLMCAMTSRICCGESELLKEGIFPRPSVMTAANVSSLCF